MASMEGFNNENIEKPTWHFSYSNNELPGHPVIFECDAPDVSTADDLYEKKLGIKPEKGSHIGCSIVKN